MEIGDELDELENGLKDIKNGDADPLAQADRKRSPGTSKDAKPSKDGYSEDTLEQQKDKKKKNNGETEGLEDSDNKNKKQKYRNSRCGRLIALIIVIVISWLIVQVWSECYTLFMKKVIKADSNRLVASICIAIIFTVLVIWLLCACGLDDLMSA